MLGRESSGGKPAKAITRDRAEAAYRGERAIQRVRAWFGPHLICEYAAPCADAQAYAETMPFRFHGLRVTIGDPRPGEKLQPLPEERLWPLTIR